MAATQTPAQRYAAAHASANGSGDARPTALQVVRDEQREGQMKDKVVFITGCSSGLGIETARAMMATGATVYVTARNMEKAKQALGDILESDRVHLLKLDLESFDSVRSCADEFKSRSKTLNILICNAGIRHVPEGRTKDGFERHWGTNHLSHLLLAALLRPTLISSSTPSFNSRIVFVSSTAHRNAPMNMSDLGWRTGSRKYDEFHAYGESKLANVYSAMEIERRYGDKGLHAWAAHPGGIRTGLQTPNLRDWLLVIKSGLMAAKRSLMSVEQGAACSTWAALARGLEGQGGEYLERCRKSELIVREGFNFGLDPGRAEWAYDEETAKTVYEESCKQAGAEV